MPPETWQGAEPSRSAVKRWQRRRQRRRRARNLPPRPQLPGDAAEPPGESLQTSSGCGEDAGSPSGWARGRSPPLGCRARCCHLSRRAARRSWWAPAPGEGTAPLEGTWLSLRARKAREWRGSARLHFSGHLLPPPGARWHRYLSPAAAPNDSSRFLRGGAVAVPRTRRRNLPLLSFSTDPRKLFTKFLEGQDMRRNQGDASCGRLHPSPYFLATD